ncbi:MAG: Brp/Blh family beta-carotene 15,15'-dioxygenase [Salinirussus sp.]
MGHETAGIATGSQLTTVTRTLGPGLLLGIVGALIVVPAIPTDLQYGILILGGVAVGLPHGALDWAALPIARRGRLAVGDVLLVGLLYAVLGGAALLTWLLWPIPAAIGFLLLTWFHWGQGDVHTVKIDYGATYLRDRPNMSLTGLVRGGIPMVVPLIAFPETYREVLKSFVQPFGASANFAVFSAPHLRLALGGGLAIVTVLALVRSRLHSPNDPVWRLDCAETATLWLFFLTVPPVLAIAVYFACWHSWRHLVRLATLDRPTASALMLGDWRRPAARFVVGAFLPTVGALGLLAGLWIMVPAPPTTAPDIVGLGLVAIATLTVPHTAIVTWLDRLRAAG